MGWLACQLAVFAAAPVVLCDVSDAELATPSCCRHTAPGQTCPMHEATEHPACTIQTSCSSGQAALMALFGVVAIPAPVFAPDHAAVTVTAISQPAAVVLSRTDRPQSPPPRS